MDTRSVPRPHRLRPAAAEPVRRGMFGRPEKYSKVFTELEQQIYRDQA